MTDQQTIEANQTSHTPASYKEKVARAAQILANLGVLDNLDSDANLVKAVQATINKLEQDKIAEIKRLNGLIEDINAEIDRLNELLGY
jgi:tRNA C32,U32 (ribose-2'-O)-methylase TrmJ